MSQVNVNPPGPVRDTGEGAAAAGINLVTVLVVVAILVAVAWFLFAGPFGNVFTGGARDVNVNVNTPTQQERPSGPNIQVNPPANQQPSAPSTKP